MHTPRNLLALGLAPGLAGCAVLGDAFKAGIGVGVTFAVIAGLCGAGIILMAMRH